MRIRLLKLTGAVLASILFHSGASAATIVSVDRATFAAAVAGGAIASEDFEGLAALSFPVTAGITYSASLGAPIVTASFLTTTAPHGLGSTSGGPGLDEFFLLEETATFIFDTAITAFAIDINTFADTDAAYSATLSTGDIVTSLFEVFPGAITGQFIGFVSDTPFTSVTIAAESGFSYTLDTVVYGDASAVVIPIPAALFLMLGALPVFGLMRRTPA